MFEQLSPGVAIYFQFEKFVFKWEHSSRNLRKTNLKNLDFQNSIEVEVLGGRTFACEALVALTCGVRIRMCMHRPSKRSIGVLSCMNVIHGCRKAGALMLQT